jgi:hypothetical protein
MGELTMTTTKLTKKAQKEIEIQQAKQELIKILEEGNHKVYTSLVSVSGSGMSRKIDVFVSTGAGEIRNINWYIEKLDLYNRDLKTGSLKVSGCGMDMGFSVVYDLSCTLYRNEDGSYSHEGAYKLKQQWL